MDNTIWSIFDTSVMETSNVVTYNDNVYYMEDDESILYDKPTLTTTDDFKADYKVISPKEYGMSLKSNRKHKKKG